MSDNEEELDSLFNFDDDPAEAEAPSPIPKGQYIGEIVGGDAKTSDQGKRGVLFSFRIDADQFPPEYEAEEEYALVSNYVSRENTAKAKWLYKKFCNAIGMEPAKTASLSDFIGRTALLTVDHRTGNDGLIYPSIKRVELAE